MPDVNDLRKICLEIIVEIALMCLIVIVGIPSHILILNNIKNGEGIRELIIGISMQ